MAHSAVHHEIQTIKRSAGQSATARIAYVCRTEITDERTGETHRYRDKDDELAGVHLVGFKGSPEAFANSLEASERRKDGQVGRSSIIALPNELDEAACERIVLGYQKHLQARYGCASLSAVHRKDGNTHVHIIESTRDAAGQKITSLSNKKTSGREVEHRRETWAQMVNNELERSSPTSDRVDHRSLKRRLEAGDETAMHYPVPHLGPARHAAIKAVRKKRPLPNWVRSRWAEANRIIGLVKALKDATTALNSLRNSQTVDQRLRAMAERKILDEAQARARSPGFKR